MCEYWSYTCGHTFSKACDLPKLKQQAVSHQISAASGEQSQNLEPYSIVEAQKRAATFHPTDPSKCCPGYPPQPKPAHAPCFACLQSQVALRMAGERPRIDAVRAKRAGAGTDNWGYSSRGMTGFGHGGNSSWMDQYGPGNGGFGTYLGGGRSMPDRRRTRRDPNPPTTERSAMRLLPPGGVSSWPLGAGGTLSVPGSQRSNSSSQGSHPGPGPGPRCTADDGRGSTQFNNPFVRSQSEGDHVDVRGGLGNGSFGYEAFMNAKRDDEAARNRYKSV